jgi:GT2 family glycosyltransferase
MAKVTIVQVIYNNRPFIEPVFSAIFSQTHKDFNVVAVISGNDDGGKELLAQKFPQVEIIDPGFNIGFAAGHNLVFERYQSNFFQLVNPDLILEPSYVERMLKAFDDPKVGAATGKLLRYDFGKNQKTNIIDTTGVTIAKSGRARDRGQHEEDMGQYDQMINVQAVSAAGCMYRRSALESVKFRKIGKSENWTNPTSDKSDFPTSEYFDEDFHSYWEDVDLSWRMANAGWKNVFVPKAVGYHGRGAGSSEKGYADVVGFIRHHKKLSPYVRRLNYQNHIFMYVKNSPFFYPQFFVREFFMFWYILFFEVGTLKVLPQMFKLFPKMWGKRKFIKSNLPFRTK